MFFVEFTHHVSPHMFSIVRSVIVESNLQRRKEKFKKQGVV